MMTPETIDTAIREAERFIERAKVAREVVSKEYYWGGSSKETAACRRASMDPNAVSGRSAGAKMTKKHTHGPWKCNTITGEITRRWANRDWRIATTSNSCLGWHEDYYCEDIERAANGKLISAAPDLFDVAILARDFIQNGIELGFIQMPDAGTFDPAHETLPKILAAIAKVKGQA